MKTWERFEEIRDSDENVIIFPETKVIEIPFYKNAHVGIWWMSVDNYEHETSFRKHYSARVHMDGFLSAVYRGMQSCLNGTFKSQRENVKKAEFHLYQSEYARLYLQSKELDNILQLSDYINNEYLNEIKFTGRKNIVLYNPKKGIEFTKKLIKKAPDLRWQPIENMTNRQIIDMMSEAKVYIDFGNHPGKDRLPREAAARGCCVITGKRGAAKNDIDIPIPDEYKFEDKKSKIPAVVDKIKECFTHYDDKFRDFDSYRKVILNEKVIFKKDILNFKDFLENSICK